MQPFLNNSDFFAHLPESFQLEFKTFGHPKSYNAGETLFLKGDPGDRLIIIQEGVVEVSVMSVNGRKSILNMLNPGDVLGEIAVLDGGERSADAVAKTDVRTIELARQTVKELLTNNSEAIWSLVEVLCGRVRNASNMFETRSAALATTRISRCLLKLVSLWGKPSESGLEIDQRITQGDLGDLSGLARENVNRHLKQMMNDEVVAYQQGRFTILDKERLEALADQD